MNTCHCRLWILLVLIPVLSACSISRPDLFPAADDAEVVEVELVRHGWHVGLILPINENFADKMPEDLHLRESHRYIEIGWGDRAYYMDDSPGIWTTIKGGIWPTPSVIHLAAFERRPLQHLERIRLELSVEGYQEMLSEIAAYFTIRENQVEVLGYGLYGDSRFYASDPRYTVFRNSNKWAVRQLGHAGVPVRPAWVLFAATAMRQASRHGERLQP